MANEGSACAEENFTLHSSKREWSVPQDAYKGTGRPHQTPSEKPGAARRNPAKARNSLMAGMGQSRRSRGKDRFALAVGNVGTRGPQQTASQKPGGACRNM